MTKEVAQDPEKYSKAEKLLRRAESSRLVRYGLHFLPGGEVLEGELFQRIRAERETRVRAFREEVATRLATIEENAVPWEYLESRDFVLLFERILVAVFEADRQEKIGRLAGILEGAVRRKERYDFIAEYFIRCVERVDEAHLELLARLRVAGRTEAFAPFSSLMSPESSQDEALVIFSDLMNLRLIAERRTRGEGEALPNIKLTSLGFRFLTFLEAEALTDISGRQISRKEGEPV